MGVSFTQGHKGEADLKKAVTDPYATSALPSRDSFRSLHLGIFVTS